MGMQESQHVEYVQKPWHVEYVQKSWQECRDQTFYESTFSIMWVSGTELRSSGLVAGTFNYLLSYLASIIKVLFCF